MISLKSYCGPLSKILGLTPDALYERQRVLARSGYLSGAIAGKGPGSGIRATPANVTKLVLSTLATDALSEIEEKTRKLAAAKHGGGKCPLTGETKFQNALEKILSVGDLTESVLAIEVRRVGMMARIGFRRSDDHLAVSEFGKAEESGMSLQITAKLTGWGVEVISNDLRNISAGTPLSTHTSR
jgi:hypothetical protein